MRAYCHMIFCSMFRSSTNILLRNGVRAAHSAAKPALTIPANKLPVFPKHSIPTTSTTSSGLAAWHAAARDNGAFERPDWWAVIDALGIPSTGARPQLVHMTTKQLVDQGVPQMAIQMLPFVPRVEVDVAEDSSSGDGEKLVVELLDPTRDELTFPEHAQYVLSRSNNGTDFVGGVYLRLFKKGEVVPGKSKVHDDSPSQASSETGSQESFLSELWGLIRKRI